MNCRATREWIGDLLFRDPDGPAPRAVALHLAECPDCAREQRLARETLEAITPSHGGAVVASARFRERVLAAIPAEAAVPIANVGPNPTRSAAPPWRRRASRMRMTIAVAAASVLAMILFPIGLGLIPSSRGGAASLLSQAAAAESRLFAADDVVHLAGEIVAGPVADPELAAVRWIPLVAVGTDGKMHYQQIKLGNDPGATYRLRDESWYDPATHRFAHILSLNGRPLFANAFDGRSVHLMDLDDQGRPRVESRAVDAAFQPPRDPSEFLGVLTVARPVEDEAHLSRPDLIHEEGQVKLADGTPAHVVRITSLSRESGIGLDVDLRITIRDDNHLIESMEFVASGKTIYTIRRAQADNRREPRYGWDLAGIRSAVEKHEGEPKMPVRTLADMIRMDVTVDAMAKGADYPVYVLDRNPGWSERRQIVDILDLPSPPHRMFAAIYPAKDRRHVILVQAHSFNANLAPLTREAKLVYTAPSGIKVWSTRDDRAMAKILLSSIGTTKAIFADKPSPDCTGYLFETPDGTFPVLAVNGVLTDAELHGLADSLVRVRPK